MKIHGLRLLLALMGAALAAGCSFTGVNSYTLPLNEGGGSDALNITVLLENATNLVPNSEVKYKEVTVGSVRKIEIDGWQPTLTIGLNRDAEVPADVRANVAQKSLLGAQYLELLDPEDVVTDANLTDPVAAAEDALATEATATSPDRGLLADGDTIGLDRTDRYPETEEVLTAASLLLNGGGLPAVRTISSEVNDALTGRQDDVSSVIRQIDQTATTLDGQLTSITGALEQLDQLAKTFNDQSAVVDRALQSLPAGVDVLSQEEDQLLATLQSLGRVQDATSTAFGNNDLAFGRILDNLVPVTQAVVDVHDLAPLIESTTYPFPTSIVPGITRSDYLNLGVTIDITAEDLAVKFLGLNALEGLLTGFVDGAPIDGAGQATDPLLAPLDGLLQPDGLGPLGDILGGVLTPPLDTPASPTPAPTTGTPPRQPNLLEMLLGGGR